MTDYITLTVVEERKQDGREERREGRKEGGQRKNRWKVAGRQAVTVSHLNWHCQQPLGGDRLMSDLAIIELITTGHFLTSQYSPITTLGCTAITVGVFC